MTLTILIVGGYGTFGGRLALLLAEQAELTLIIAGRSESKAADFIATLPQGAEKVPLAFDRAEVSEAVLRQIGCDIVVDASGPFQTYGEDPYRLVRASIAAGCDYLDLADSSDFVRDIVQFDDAAQAAGVFVLSGVSSFPVLTAAVLRVLSAGMTEVHTMTGGIAPSPHAGIGGNVIAAIMSYAGQPISVVRDGTPATAYALTETRRYTIAPPGHLPLWNTRFSLVDVPDLTLIPAAVPGLKSAWMGAGTRPEFLHRALNGLSWLVRLKLVKSLSALAPLVFQVQKYVRWGEHRGGMFVELRGATEAEPTTRSWHLAAEGSDGPLIPSMAVEAIVLKILAGQSPKPGARTALKALELADYAKVFAGRSLVMGLRDDTAERAQQLYRRIAGDAWSRLPPAVRQMHEGRGRRIVRGRASITTGSSPLAGLMRRAMGFPEANADVAVSVQFDEHDGVETWTRNFGGERFSSVQAAGIGRNERLIVERFGPVRVALAVVITDGRLNLAIRSWSLFGLPMPRWLGPTTTAFEYEADGRFHFDVAMGHPLAGAIVHYRGWLEPEMQKAQPGLAAPLDRV